MLPFLVPFFFMTLPILLHLQLLQFLTDRYWLRCLVQYFCNIFLALRQHP